METETADSAGHLAATRSHEFTVDLPVAQAFTLFEPLGEKKWAPGWDPCFPTAADASLADGTVFTVERQNHAGERVQTIWLLTRYLPEAGSIEYRCVVPGERVAWVAVLCRAASATRTTVEVSYRYTALSALGDAYIRAMTEDAFRAFIESWAESIHLLKTAF